MLGSIFHKRKKPQDLRTPSLQDIKRVYKAISSQRELHSLDFRQEDITDPQLIALAETLVELPLISSLDLRDNRITDDGARALLEVLRLQIIAAKTPVPCDPKTKKPIFPQVPEYTKYVTTVNLRGNEVSAEVQQELAQYTTILRREDKRLEIRAALAQVDRDENGGIDEDEFKSVLKLLTGTEPSKRDLRSMLLQHSLASDNAQGELSLENVLLARCSSPTSNKAASPPWEALVQVRHANLGDSSALGFGTADLTGKAATDMVDMPPSSGYSEASAPSSPASVRMPSPVASVRFTERLESDTRDPADSEASSASPQHSSLNVRLDETPAATPATPTVKPLSQTAPSPNPVIPPLVFAPPSPDKRQGTMNSARSSSAALEDDSVHDTGRGSLAKQLSGGQSRGFAYTERTFTPSASSTSSPRQSEPLDSPRSATSAQAASLMAKRPVPDDSDKHSSLSPDRKALATVDSPRFDIDSISEAIGDPSDSDFFGNDSSTDDILLSVLSQSSDSGSRKGETAISDNQGNNSIPRSVLELQGFGSGKRSSSGDVSASTENVHEREGAEKSTSPAEEPSQFNIDAANECQSDEISHDASDWLVEKNISEDSAATDQVPGSTIDSATNEVDARSEVSDDEEEEHTDIVDAEVAKDGKPRTVMKLVHTGLKSGLKLTDFPSEIPFRNLLVLILSDNKLRDLTLFEECRFPCVIVLDLSHNRLAKVPDKALAMFPKLQMLDMANNQLKCISGVFENFKLRALNVSHNCIRSVTNIEHLVFLEVLTLSANNITVAQSLRLLSLNKMLSRIDLDGNAIVDADERQRRKNIAYILNLVPTLTSLGSISCASRQSKEKKKKVATASMENGTSLFDVSYFPQMETSWVKRTCDSLGCFQDKPPELLRDRGRDDDDDEDGYGEDCEATNNVKKHLNRAQQRQKDEMRSRAVAYRSREKAPPSPPKAKSSIYSFGPPLPPPSPRKKKKQDNTPVDPAVARRQLRRSSELSAPRHPPVDTALLEQEKKRKSRTVFDQNMSVPERLLLAQEQAQRRTSSAVTRRSNSSKRQPKRVSTGNESRGTDSALTNQQEPVPASTKPGSPLNLSPSKAVVAFRIEPLSPIRRQDVLEFRVETPRPAVATPAASSTMPQPEQKAETPSSPRGVVLPAALAKEDNNFLRSLAVGDFLTHAAEELSTALTALNVLLSMCEKELRDRNKLHGYRASLEVLGILDEHESHALYEKTKAFGVHTNEAQCAEAFERLGLVKRCVRQLLEKLQDHEPGSAVIRAFCRSMRSVELRSVLSDYGEPSPESRSQDMEKVPTQSSHSLEVTDTAVHVQPSPTSMNSRLFGSSGQEGSEQDPSSVEQVMKEDPSESVKPEASNGGDLGSLDDAQDNHDVDGDIGLDFLEPATSLFGADAPATSEFDVESDGGSQHNPDSGVASMEPSASLDVVEPDGALDEAASTFEAALLQSSSGDLTETTASSSYPVSSDITFDIQMESDTSAFEADDAEGSGGVDLSICMSGEETPGSGSSSSPTQDILAEKESFGGVTTDDDWLGGGTTTDADALESIVKAKDSEISWGETDGFSEVTRDVGRVSEVDDPVDDPNSLVEDDSSAPSIWSEEVHCDDQVGSTVESGDYQETGETEIGESPGGYEAGPPEEYQSESVNAGEEQSTEYDTTAPAAYAEDEATYEEVDAEATEAQATEQEFAAGEDADDEEAETFGDWEKGFDPNSNHYFWFNHATGESSWEPPEGWPFEVDEPFEAEGECVAEDGEAVEKVEEGVDEPVYSNDGDEVVGGGGYAAAEDGSEVAGGHEDPVSRVSEFDPSHVSEFEFDDSDLPTF